MNQVVKKPDRPELREAIFNLEHFMEGQPQVEIETIHRFAPGVYTREMVVPAGVMLTGYIHKTEHISIFLQGKMLIPDENGGSKEITAPIVETAQPGVKRVGVALEDVRWITVHPTEETDIEVLEGLLVTNDFSEVEYLVDQQDYALIGIPEDVIEFMEAVEWHKGDVEGVEVRVSKRHGLGVFVTDKVVSGAIIAPAIENGRLMEYSRYANHSMNPNARCVYDGVSADLVALRDIENEEVTVDYRRNLLELPK